MRLETKRGEAFLFYNTYLAICGLHLAPDFSYRCIL